PDWIGFSAWDLVMPLFLFIVGVVMPFSFARRIERGERRAQLYEKLIRRTLLLFVLGMAAQGHLLDFKISTLHIFCNTLQAIAAGYLIAGVTMINLPVLGQAMTCATLLITYWLLMILVPVPGHGAGVIEPNANLALAVDEFVLGRFRDGTNYTWILTSMGFGATVLIGVLAGHGLRSGARPSTKLQGLVVTGLLCLATGWVWSEWIGFPMIKHIWTSSMALWAGGWSLLLLAFFYGLIDVVRIDRWAFPLVVIGTNAIAIYLAVHFIPFREIAKTFVGGLARHCDSFCTDLGAVLVAFATLLLVWMILYHMYRRKIFLRI
ncbi:MAG: DUF5009 domain-containing protein, partial [Planctomycetaceae bacterium]|nr:DUF5009 domain-containing protein [Planctomycetaceae bacterium]